jgi:hypothetical protein
MTAPSPSRSTSLLAGGAQATIAVFDWLRSFGRYYQWFKLMTMTAASGTGRRIHRAVGRKAPAIIDVQDFASAPAYYQELIDHLTLPDRLPLAPLERSLPGEATAIAAVSRLAASAVIRTYCEVKKADPDVKAMRDQHAKPHACVRARFLVDANLPTRFAHGVFRRGAVYEAVIRFSNAMGTPRSDRKSDGRGMAIKFFLDGTDAENVLSRLMPGNPATEQDFLMTNFPVFFCRDVADYTSFMTILALPSDGLIAKFRSQLQFILFFVPWRLPQLQTFLTQAFRKIDSPLRETYHSMTPYQLGGDNVVRYFARPLQTPAPLGGATDLHGDDFLHDAMVSELNPATHRQDEKAVFEFCVRRRGHPTSDDVENASQPWDAASDTTVTLGRIEIPLQSFARADNLCACENFSFNPWNALPAHRPLGGLNRMRLAVYLASKQVRHQLNMV